MNVRRLQYQRYFDGGFSMYGIESSQAPISPWLNGASFWSPHYLTHSAWLQHVPFAFWLVTTARPSSIVELGTHRGLSYFAFCQAVVAAKLQTTCVAVDTWQGDEHAGNYGETIYATVTAYNDRHYEGFSRLVRSTFQEALAEVPDNSVDLLHVDGRHFYEDVREDFTSWERKLSPRAIVLFHDTTVIYGGFGVHRYWAEVRDGRPSFEFLHGHGLGVLGYGKDVPDAVSRFLTAGADPAVRDAIRGAYGSLGASVETAAKAAALRDTLANQPNMRLSQSVRKMLGLKQRKLKAGGWVV